MKKFYFVYPKYFFLGLLIYTLFVLSRVPDIEVGATGIVFGLILPFLPVWFSFHFARKIDQDLKGSVINVFTLLAPLVVITLEVYFIVTVSLVTNGSITGLLAAFGVGTLAFFILLCINLMLSVFAKNT